MKNDESYNLFEEAHYQSYKYFFTLKYLHLNLLIFLIKFLDYLYLESAKVNILHFDFKYYHMNLKIYKSSLFFNDK